MDATNAPTTASDTMDTAGIKAASTPKCFKAKTCAKVGDLDKTSMTKARLDRSGITSFSTDAAGCGDGAAANS